MKSNDTLPMKLRAAPEPVRAPVPAADEVTQVTPESVREGDAPSPPVEDVLDGFGGLPRTHHVKHQANSDGRSAARYDAVAAPVRRHTEPGRAVPVIVSNTTQIPPPPGGAAADGPNSDAPVAKSALPAGGSNDTVPDQVEQSGPLESAAPVAGEVTVPGLRRRRSPATQRAAMAVGIVVVAGGLSLLGLPFLKGRRAGAERSGSEDPTSTAAAAPVLRERHPSDRGAAATAPGTGSDEETTTLATRDENTPAVRPSNSAHASIPGREPPSGSNPGGASVDTGRGMRPISRRLGAHASDVDARSAGASSQPALGVGAPSAPNVARPSASPNGSATGPSANSVSTRGPAGPRNDIKWNFE